MSEKGYLDNYSHLLATGDNNDMKNNTNTTTTTASQPPPRDPTKPLQPLNKFVKPCSGDGRVNDIEDIIHNGVCRPRPDKIKWMCTFRRKLIPGETYRWCQCGKSGDIYCDDTCTEEPTRLGPFEFSVADKVTQHALCGCRYTAHPPFCDGTHGIPYQDMEEWLEDHPEEAHRVPWLCKGKEVENGQEQQEQCDAIKCLGKGGDDEAKSTASTDDDNQQQQEPAQ